MYVHIPMRMLFPSDRSLRKLCQVQLILSWNLRVLFDICVVNPQERKILSQLYWKIAGLITEFSVSLHSSRKSAALTELQ